MSYCTRQDLIDRFGVDLLVQTTDYVDSDDADNSVLNAVIADADAEIDAYLSAKYTTPIEPTPALLKRCACEMVRYYLMGDRVPDSIRQKYEDVIALLLRILEGDVTLTGDTRTGANTVAFQVGNHVWTRSTTGGL